MNSPKALLLCGTTNNGDPLRALMLGEGCDVEEKSIEAQSEAVAKGYSLVLFHVHRPTPRVLVLAAAWRDAVPETTLLVVGDRIARANRMAVLEAGVNAYLTKPVVIPEFLARIRAALRRFRSQDARMHRCSLGTSTIDLDARTIRAADSNSRLTPTECVILAHLASHPNQTVPCNELVKTIWGADPQKGAHSLRLLIKRLRNKLEPDPTNPRYLVTDHAIGYRLQTTSDPLRQDP
ncbi:MAG: response regulator transcription factor [Acidobacteriia bacterium]|nr:response regulator transcription factor [Terriglobia bacterium]